MSETPAPYAAAAPLVAVPAEAAEGKLLTDEQLSEIAKRLHVRQSWKPTYPHFFSAPAFRDADITNLLSHTAALTARLQEAEAAGAAKKLVGESAALFAHVRRLKDTCAHNGLIEAARWYRLEDVLDHAEAALAETQSLRAELAQEGEQERVRLEDVLASLYDEALHVVSESESGPMNDFKRGVNHERRLNAKLIQLKAEELGLPWPLKSIPAAEVKPKADAAAPVVGEGSQKGGVGGE